MSLALEWKESMSVGIERFDNDHKKIIALIRSLDASLRTSDPEQAVREVLAELSNYCIYHLFAEEEAMEKAAYKGYEAHRQEHLKFVEKIFSVIERVHKGESDTGRELLGFLWEWFGNHILVVDRQYSETLKAKGIV